MKTFSERTEGAKIIENSSNISWSYQNSDNFFGYVQADELKTHYVNEVFEIGKNTLK